MEGLFLANVPFALLLTLIAGLSTGIGSLIAYFIRKPKTRYLSFSLGFSGGVMIYVSFMEMMPSSVGSLGEVMASVSFFAGVLVIGFIDLLVPKAHNPHDFKKPGRSTARKRSLMNVGVFTAVAIAIHNFPEGLAVFGTAAVDVRLGALIALAIAIHNVPEGISVSMPVFYATGNRRKAFIYSALSGLSEPLGALIGLFILLPFISQSLMAMLLAFVAGIMVYIALDKILPAATSYGESHTLVVGTIIGMVVMAASIVLL